VGNNFRASECRRRRKPGNITPTPIFLRAEVISSVELPDGYLKHYFKPTPKVISSLQCRSVGHVGVGMGRGIPTNPTDIPIGAPYCKSLHICHIGRTVGHGGRCSNIEHMNGCCVQILNSPSEPPPCLQGGLRPVDTSERARNPGRPLVWSSPGIGGVRGDIRSGRRRGCGFSPPLICRATGREAASDGLFRAVWWRCLYIAGFSP